MPLYTVTSSGGGGGGTPPSNAAFGPAWSGSSLAPTQNATYAYISTELLTKSSNLAGLADPVAALVNLNGLSTTGGTLNIQATSSAGSITPLTGSYIKITRLPAANVGAFV